MVGLCLMAALCLPLTGHTQQSSIQSSEKDYQRGLSDLKTRIGALNQQLSRAKGERGKLQASLQRSEVAIGQLNRELKQTRKQQQTQKAKLAQLHSQRKDLQVSKRTQESHISQHMRAAYKLGQQSNIKLLLNQESPQNLSRMLQYYDYFLKARTEKLDTYRNTLTALSRLEPQIEAETSALEKSRQNLLQQRERLTRRQEERESTMNRLTATIDSKDRELLELDADKKHLQRLLTEVAEAIAKLPINNQALNKHRGVMTLPVKGTITQSFGSPRAQGKMRWEGILIKAGAGSNVNAIHHGQVVFSDYLKSYGLLLIIDHGNGYMSLYAHNQSLQRDVGDWVEPGEVIAEVGSSGGQSSAGLYFELRHQGGPVDPSSWFNRG